MEKLKVTLKIDGKSMPIEEAERREFVETVRCSICGNVVRIIDKTKRSEIKEVKLWNLPLIKDKQLENLKAEISKMQRYCPWCGAPISIGG